MRFVLSNPNVDVSLSGMSTIDHVEENVAVCSQDIELNAEEREAIDAHLDRLKGLAELYCTGCRYCMPCPEGVEIPFIFDVYNRGRVYGLWDSAKESYAQIGRVPWAKGKDASACTGCATCEDKCPQNIPIRKQLKEAHAALAGE
jgi:hypothetical protein